MAVESPPVAEAAPEASGIWGRPPQRHIHEAFAMKAESCLASLRTGLL